MIAIRLSAGSLLRGATSLPVAGKIDLFRVEHQPSADLFEQDPFLGWNGMALGGIEVHDLPGYHGQHLREPNVKILGQKMLRCLDSDRSS